MNKPFIEIDAEHFTLSAFETKPIEGYEAPTNKETGEQFPNCCPFHKSVFEGAESWFSKFPNCCDQHKAMVSKWWYNKANYSGIAEKIVKQLSYTEHHISERINIDDWYKDITDYIEYNVSSFGHPAIGLHLYLGNVKHYIKNTNSEIPKIKRQVLIEFIETYYNSPIDIDKTNKTDLNVLYSTYQKWLKVFPFEISFFSTLKPHFEKQLPILNGKPETNKYTGLAKVKMHTKSSLIDVLLNLTNNLLTQINTTTLYEKGLLTEPQKIKLELVLNERKMKLKQGYVNSSKDEEQRYRKILKEWFADEKRFIDEVTPIVKALPPQPIIESPFSVLEWATIFYYADETKLLTESRLIKTRLEQFMSKHQINTTFDNFKTKYYEAKKRINEKNDYPINKLELIIPFLKENYKQTVTKVENDIIFLEENKPEY